MFNVVTSFGLLSGRHAAKALWLTARLLWLHVIGEQRHHALINSGLFQVMFVRFIDPTAFEESQCNVSIYKFISAMLNYNRIPSKGLE